MYILRLIIKFINNDGVIRGSPLGPALVGIFMVELENWIIPTLGNMVLNWKRFVDDTISYVKNGSIDIIYQSLIVSLPTYSLLTK